MSVEVAGLHTEDNINICVEKFKCDINNAKQAYVKEAVKFNDVTAL